MPAPLSPAEIVRLKRDGRELDQAGIESWIRGVADGSFADYQSAALLMAVFLRGMSARETAWLTGAMMRSGEVIELPEIAAPKVDKHSTGGVGDKVSLVLAPLAAAAGLCVPMISGRGLGHTGGTLDKLEAIPGFRVGLSSAEFRAQLAAIGLALAGQTSALVPADKKLYALRDVTATVESIPLICASIMSKKLAEGIGALVLDVKFGRAAFMRRLADARALARAMAAIGRAMNRPVVALLTDMNRPLGRAVGHAVEVAEAIECLRGRGPKDVMEVTMALGAKMVLLGGLERTAAAARRRLRQALVSGAAATKFRDVIAAQGGDPGVVDAPSRLPQARRTIDVPAPAGGYVRDVDALKIAHAARCLGAARERVEDGIDHAVGFSRLAQAGERVVAGGLLFRMHVDDERRLDEALDLARRAFVVGPEKPALLPIVREEIGG